MIGYAEKEIFTLAEKDLLRRARLLVERAPNELFGEPIRCHELARAVGRVLGLDHEDGRFGFVEHTWLWTEPRHSERFCTPWVLPRILDVYVPGALPQVQLVDTASGLPPRYYLSHVFDVEIRENVIEEIIEWFKAF